MRPLLTTTICFCLIAGFITGCFIPIPVPLLPGDEIHKVEADIEQLAESKATKIVVIEKLGGPRKYREKSMSYKVCRESGGIGIIPFPFIFYDIDEGYRGYGLCVELLLNFDDADRLSGFLEINPWVNNYKIKDERLILASLANQGDKVAAWILYIYHGRKPENVDFLCQAAEGGIIKAQNLLGKYYSSGKKKGIPRDLKNAYLWYKKAATETVADDDIYDNSIGESSRKHLIYLERSMTPEEIIEAENLYSNWEPGQCERDLSDASRKVNLDD